jgi:hypothetical protein
MIELHPEGAGNPIVGDWKEASALYLVGGSSGFRFCPRIQPGDMPVAVACRESHGVLIAPVHPLCHVSEQGQLVSALTSGQIIQLGTEKYRISVADNAQTKKVSKQRLMMAALIAAALLCGWWFHGLFAANGSTVATTDVYTF